MEEREGFDYFKSLREIVNCYGDAPLFSEMHKRTLKDKGIEGPTAAHVIEEVHVPLNLAGITFTTGSSAFQNIVGITFEELDKKKEAGIRTLKYAGVKKGTKILFCYPPLVNVFTKEALTDFKIEWQFLKRSSRDSLMLAIYDFEPDLVVGESSFLRATLEDINRLSLKLYIKKMPMFIAAGTPLDFGLVEIANEVFSTRVMDLYGCQEFGCLTLNGELLREDISLVPSPLGDDFKEIVVGGLPTGDSFPIGEPGHALNKVNSIITYKRKRTYPEYEVEVLATKASTREVIERAARTILRIKSKVVRVHPNVTLNSKNTILRIKGYNWGTEKNLEVIIEGPEKTFLFESLVNSQINYEKNGPKDPGWLKRR